MSVSGVVLTALYVILVALPVALAVWLGPREPDFVHELGKTAALAGFAILMLQAALAARWKWASRPFGFDIVIRFHRHVAMLAVLLLVAHPLLLAASGGGWNLLVGLNLPWPIWVGKAALVLLLVNVAASVWRKRLKLTFERWRVLHDIAAVTLLACAFVHSWVIGDDLELPALQALWVVAGAGVAAVLVWHRFIGPALRKRNPYRVAAVTPEADDVWTVELEPPEGKDVEDYLSGQFHFLTLHRDPGLPHEEHHFTISSSPARPGRISSTIKAVGDFTSTIKDTKAGDAASVQGPYGRFSYELRPDERDLVFIAGGIGVTPLMSMLRAMRDREDDLQVLMLYGNRTESSIVFRDELAQLEAADRPSLKVVHVLSHAAEAWQGETGYVDQDMLKRHVTGDLTKKTFYVCGPPPMIDLTLSNLREMGVEDRQIRLELFSLVDG